MYKNVHKVTYNSVYKQLLCTTLTGGRSSKNVGIHIVWYVLITIHGVHRFSYQSVFFPFPKVETCFFLFFQNGQIVQLQSFCLTPFEDRGSSAERASMDYSLNVPELIEGNTSSNVSPSKSSKLRLQASVIFVGGSENAPFKTNFAMCL